MKKLFLLISLAAVVFTACKKDDNTSSGGGTTTGLSITASDLGNAGDSMLMNVDTTDLAGFSVGTPGQSITWDFSAAGTDRVDTTAFLITANTPGGTFFPTATMAVQPQVGQPIYMFINKTSDKVEGIGMWANFQGTEVHAEYTDRPILMKFPMIYGSQYSDSSYIEVVVDMSGTNYKSGMSQKIISNVDGSGTVKLPNEQFACIREKHTEISYTNLYMQLGNQWLPVQSTTDTTYSYNFFAKNQKWNVASVKVDNFESNIITEISYKK